MTYGIPSWIPVFVELSTLMKNISSWLDRIVTIRATEVLIREEPEMIFFHGNIIDNSS